MKKYAFLASVLLIQILIIVFVLNIKADSLPWLDAITKSISTFCSAATLFIAILFYKKFGMDEPIKQKQLEVVLKCLEKSKKTFIFFEKEGHVLNFRPTEQGWYQFSDCDDEPVVFHRSFFYGLQSFGELTEDLYFPTELKKHIPFISSPVITSVDIKDIKNYFVAKIPGHEGKEEFIGTAWEREFKIKNIKEAWKIFINELINWINKNSNKKIDLNILK